MMFTTIGQAKKKTGLSYLGGINTSSKLAKNKKVSGNLTYIIYLAPSTQSGYNVCLFSTPECRLGCLATSGRASMELHSQGVKRIQNARIKKSKLFFEDRAFFMDWMITEIKQAQRKAIKDGYDFSVRLNGTSDIDWANIRLDGANIFEHFPNTNFYDYSKHYLKFTDNIPNYHLTFSYSGYNTNECINLLNTGKNVAVIFNVKNVNELPKTFMGYEVINGDLTDARFLDKKGVIVGLKWKNIANKTNNNTIKQSVFVIQQDDKRCEY